MSKFKKGPKSLINWKRGKKEKKTDFEFLLEKTHFNEKELTIIWNQFHKEIPGGTLARSTFHTLVTSVTGMEDEKLNDMMFQAFDAENLGYIDYRQWVIAFSIMTRGTLEEKLHFTFNIYDVERRGSLNLSNFLDIVETSDPGAREDMLGYFPGKELDFDSFVAAVGHRPSLLLGFRSLFTRHDMRTLVARSESQSLSTSESESASLFSNWATSGRIIRSESRDFGGNSADERANAYRRRPLRGNSSSYDPDFDNVSAEVFRPIAEDEPFVPTQPTSRKLSKLRVIEKRREKKEERRRLDELGTVREEEEEDNRESKDSPLGKRRTSEGKKAKAVHGLKSTGALVARGSNKVKDGVTRKILHREDGRASPWQEPDPDLDDSASSSSDSALHASESETPLS